MVETNLVGICEETRTIGIRRLECLLDRVQTPFDRRCWGPAKLVYGRVSLRLDRG